MASFRGGDMLAWVVLLMLVAGPAHRTVIGDDWPSPVIQEVFSQSRDWFVRVVPGRSLGDTVGFSGSPKGPYAKGEWYRRQGDRSYKFLQQVTLLNPVAPVKFLVTDRGDLVTLDNWHNMGYGRALVAYGPDGRMVASFALKDLFSVAEVSAFRHSTSSIWWRTDAAYVREGQVSVHVSLNDKGHAMIFEPGTGGWQICDWQGPSYLCRSANDPRVWRAFAEPGNSSITKRRR